MDSHTTSSNFFSYPTSILYFGNYETGYCYCLKFQFGYYLKELLLFENFSRIRRTGCFASAGLSETLATFSFR